MIYQRTLKSPIHAVGVGLHSGEKVELTLSPAPADTGIVFRRADLPERPSFRVGPDLVNDTRLSSTLVKDGVRVATIEHLMSAFAGLGIDNVLVDVTASEMPIMDGSAAPFLYLIQQAGVVDQKAKKRFVRVKKSVEAVEGDKWVRLHPHEGYKVKLTIEFKHPAFQKSAQTVELDFAQTSYIKEVARARTFGFMHEVEYMRTNNLGQGGSMENAIVLDEYKVLNQEGLRFEDEFVRHKVLDAIGDLYILGHPLIASFEGFKSGHAMNNKLLRVLLADPDAWEYASFDSPEDAPSSFHRYLPNQI
ncbi:UDP-3-O-[3-hydroxymyristoyl] N-acetylglucosamine deacetylase [Chitinimonas taiwanensis DSM 18899]|jgi:UDP-3-O-[3-hydroxymyristoyl] N-acetylglucosamine deacetylase|uniref:UDP-3-O-acyl-N-acetylglucosamine deacetylase n=1 Tax=Chitinimonas taiwanensis DSM 18899 TaxID=1121279 RepID=A0A1K2HNV9_9NEIS|nr:UDP-3-O-acyl-N-acetylglucosamine deacetylase [Chitinimonas taiwanensis]SFZ78435.1 UDP-3-O-[3-hydroxymyristoyl] N-acetylglucosamine deacetylase [Chitinimonas taiwanensis DSM 18899]